MALTKILFIFSLLVSLGSAFTTNILDFCVADYNFPITPTGYPCKNPANLTVDDFVFSGLGVPGNTSNVFKLGVNLAFDFSFPALNGLGIGIGRLDIGVGGVVPLHAHRATEILLLMEGSILTGFIGSDNTAYYKTLNKGDIMVFPASLLHFQANVGSVPAVAFSSLNSANPGFENVVTSLGGNDLPTEVIKRISLLDASQIRKLKKLFGGSN
ncbi:unnamed protein product [Amaranthus hypochondriacus]